MGLADSLRLGISIGRELWVHHRPFLLYLKPTPRCDCRCQTCNRWQQEGDGAPELSTEEVRLILAKFRRAGCVVLTLWGGEPTLRRDLDQILRSAKELGFRTSMCTNGRTLARRARRFVEDLDVLLCSLDGYGPVHDEIRGVPGLFDRMVQGIEEARRLNPSCEIKIWASVHRRDLDQLEALASLAKELEVGIEFFPLSPIAGYNDELLLDPDQRAEAFGEVRRLRRNSWPVRNPVRALAIMERGGPMTCNFGRISIHVDHTGRVCSCEDATGRPFHVWGQWHEVDPEAIFASQAFTEVADRLRHCGQCQLPCAVELSGNLPQALAGMFFKFID